MAELTTGDLALMRDDGLGGNNSFMWIFALLLLIYGGNGFGGFGGGRFPAPDVATNGAMTAGFNNQATQAQLQQIALSSANNNYETARLIQSQTAELVAQNNTNLINANHQSTGLSVNAKGSLYRGICQVQAFNQSAMSDSVTPAQFKAALESYSKSVKDALDVVKF